MATVETQDLLPVRSRVSWGAIAAGAVVALAVGLLLSALGTAMGLTISGRIDEQGLRTGAGIWAVVSLLIALFVGGCVASRCTVGETKSEAMAYGVLVWGVVVALMLWLAAVGLRMGFTAVISLASSPAAVELLRMSDAELRNLGLTQEQISRLRGRVNEAQAGGQTLTDDGRAITDDPRTTSAAWWTFAGMLLSMLAAVGGAVAASGPEFSIAGFRIRTSAVGVTSFPSREVPNR